MNFILAKFRCKCAETGATIQKHEACLYDKATKKAYCSNSIKYKGELEASFTSNFIEAEQNAYFDKFCSINNI